MCNKALFSQNCRLTYRILLKFDGRYMTPVSLPHYQVYNIDSVSSAFLLLIDNTCQGMVKP